jgi:hypothetical protein
MILSNGIIAIASPAGLPVAAGSFVGDSPAAWLLTSGQQAVRRSRGVIFRLQGRRSLCLTRISL